MNLNYRNQIGHTMALLLQAIIVLCFTISSSTGFIVTRLAGGSNNNYITDFVGRKYASIVALDMAKVGIFFGTSTGNTEAVADMIAEELGDDADGPFDIDTLETSVQETFSKYPSLIVGTPTWNTGADTERSGTGWDEIYYTSMQELNLQGKKIAVFGLGDQVSYAENYADATGELHDVFEGLGCQMMGYTSQEGYEHEASKAIRGDKFCGLLCDMVNQEDLSEERVQNWIAQLRVEGFMDGGAAAPVDVVASAPAAATPAAVPVTPAAASHSGSQEEIIARLEETNAALLKKLEEFSTLVDEEVTTQSSNNGYTPHYNPITKSTMWTSKDGRSCYYTLEAPTTSASP